MKYKTYEELDREEGFNSVRGILIGLILAILMWGLMAIAYCCQAHAEENGVKVDLIKIAMIESSGNHLAHNKRDDSRGLYQITPICLKEWNNFHPGEMYSKAALWNPAINTKIANWYLNVRIPQMLCAHKVQDTVENRIIAYNAGISCLAMHKPLPKITIKYLKKYRGKS